MSDRSRKDECCIVITGAGGGLGGALASAYAAPQTHLVLWGRNAARLEETGEICRERGASVRTLSQDIRALSAVRERLAELDAECRIDLAFLNAGVSSGALPDGDPEPVEDACRTMEVNALGNINMAAFLAQLMRGRGGHIVCISSLAALYPLPDSPAYCASKSALAVYARALRAAYAGTSVRISIVYPGYVDSPMSRRLLGPQPLRISAGAAASLIRSRLEAGADDITFPFLPALGVRCLNLLPAPAASFFSRRFGFKVRPDDESPARG
ncbi:MAG: SDR family NAD(P)-dependent oxidoreductase [Desulfovibrio sp.]|nr:SDR family NAD(P)-dependent oxidoreductase [Desulfovibrio sp.]